MPITPDQALVLGLLKKLGNVPPEVSSVFDPPTHNVEDIGFNKREQEFLWAILRPPRQQTTSARRGQIKHMKKSLVASILQGVDADLQTTTGQVSHLRSEMENLADIDRFGPDPSYDVFETDLDVPTGDELLDEIDDLTVDRNEAIRTQHVLSQEKTRRRELLRRISKVLKTGKFAPILLVAGLLLGAMGAGGAGLAALGSRREEQTV
jgi:hypothetical protein